MERNVVLTRGDLKIPCKVTVPDFGEIRRVVLGVHGMGGSMVDDIQMSISEEMDLFYSATVRFDFPGHGQSEWEDPLALQPCLDSMMAAAEFARESFPEVEDLCIFATGFGAYITLLCLEELMELPGTVKLVIQSPCLRMHDNLITMTRRYNKVTLESMERVTLRSKRPIDVTYSFYEELRNAVALTTHPIPMLILHGEDDLYIKMDDIRQFHRINERSKLVIIPGTSHQFLEEGAWDMVLDLTRDWFEFEQVLLSDWS